MYDGSGAASFILTGLENKSFHILQISINFIFLTIYCKYPDNAVIQTYEKNNF